jgi:hypothetical protein
VLLGFAIEGALVGYVSGVLVGGVFMAAEFLRNATDAENLSVDLNDQPH